MPVSRRLLANAVATRLTTVTNATGYYGQIGRPLPGLEATTPADPPVKSAQDARVKPYFVLFPHAGTPDVEPDLGDGNDDLDWPVAVTAAGSDVEDVLALADRIHAQLFRWAPVVAGVVVGVLRPPPGYEAPLLPDRDFTPHRLYVPLRYQLTATT